MLIHLLSVRAGHRDLLGGGGDGVNGAHEDVCHDEHTDEAVEKAGQVQAYPAHKSRVSNTA